LGVIGVSLAEGLPADVPRPLVQCLGLLVGAHALVQPGEVIEAGGVFGAVFAHGRTTDVQCLQAGRLRLTELAQLAVSSSQLAQAVGQFQRSLASLEPGLLAGAGGQRQRLRVATPAQKSGDLFVELAERRVFGSGHGAAPRGKCAG
jgi:hypothetical protein